MGRMTCVAGNSLRRMLRVIESLLQFSGDVAGLAAIGVFLRGAAEAEYQFVCQSRLCIVSAGLLFGIDVGFAWAVTGFTGQSGFTAGLHVRVCRLPKLGSFGFVAASAGLIG